MIAIVDLHQPARHHGTLRQWRRLHPHRRHSRRGGRIVSQCDPSPADFRRGDPVPWIGFSRAASVRRQAFAPAPAPHPAARGSPRRPPPALARRNRRCRACASIFLASASSLADFLGEPDFLRGEIDNAFKRQRRRRPAHDQLRRACGASAAKEMSESRARRFMVSSQFARAASDRLVGADQHQRDQRAGRHIHLGAHGAHSEISSTTQPISASAAASSSPSSGRPGSSASRRSRRPAPRP